MINAYLFIMFRRRGAKTSDGLAVPGKASKEKMQSIKNCKLNNYFKENVINIQL